MKRHALMIATAIVALVATPAWATESYQAKVISITDGDTVTVLHEEKQVRIRLYGIDTPEKRQAYGKKAKQFTSGLVFGKVVKVVPMDTDRYGRTVALIQVLDDDVTVNEALVKNGYAWVYRKYCKAGFCPAWITNEQSAKTQKTGLWADPHPLPPWQYRRR